MRSGICRNCEKYFENSSLSVKYQYYCSRDCAVKYRTNHHARYKTSSKIRSKTPERYLRSLIQKKKLRENLSYDYYITLYYKQQGLCALSGRVMTHQLHEGIVPTNISIDRIDSSKGYVEGNIQLVCRQANMMKYTSSEQELLEWCKDVVKTLENKNRKI